ncbi:hypothetical protein K443DRAFT_674418 [Laccaria amethystina LaAM-08-1]|uniref:Nuclear condensin complex subunit 3 C-terminal domain-containing protein n=1 Tax=Laccaria amethystina LaAM-08-1 TaxID=1095629 RepID=A0A0C9X2S7_9AGAR|nr:hypothetical protein K443DRAFT_674418 [Laccaria amethystina LaAM-08-1]
MVKSTRVLDDLQETIAALFDQAQSSIANHKKNCVTLYKLHVKAAAITKPSKAGVKPIGERAFGDVFIDMISRVLPLKKGPATADRIVKYVGAYVQFINEKVALGKSNAASSSSAQAPDSADEEDNFTTRFVARLLQWLLQGFVAKNKNIRYRCIHFVAEMISHIGEVDEDMYSMLRDNLMDRLFDKEPLIRSHAVAALSKLVGTEDPDEIEEGEKSILEILLDVVSSDAAAEVRRTALLNVPLSSATLDAVLSRTRDVDPLTRKIVYTGVLQTRLSHPRQLTIAQREQVVKDGLGDREPGVRVAAGKLVASWFDIVLTETDKAEEATWEGDDGGVMKGLIRFLALFDVVGPGETIAVDAMTSIFVTRPDLPTVFTFPDAYWKNLTPESVVLARVFVEHCISVKNDTLLEAAALPVVTAFAFHMQESYNLLLEALEDLESANLTRGGSSEADEDEELEEELAKREVILGELLRVVLKLDYGDEIGRRKVFTVVKDMLGHPKLPPGLIQNCFDVLKEIMPSERDLIRIVVEIIVDLREGDDDGEDDDNQVDHDDPDTTLSTIRKERSLLRTKGREEMSTEERIDADAKDIRCLLLCIAMLERVDGSFEDNSTLEGILADLIIPSVKRKELAMREKALISLGLCCLIAKNMALSSFQLFVSQAQNASTELKLQVIRVIFDLLFMYDQDFFGHSEDIAKRIIDFLLQTLEAEESPAVQVVLCTGFCKLLLAGIITDPNVLTCLALMYVSPTTVDNQELRQCLSYFFPVYAYASSANQSYIQSIFIPAFDFVSRTYEEIEEGQEMISPYQFGLLLIDWTNPQRTAEIAAKTDSQEVHVDFAIVILLALYDDERSVDDHKVLCQLLGQLQINPGLDQRSIHKLDILISHHEQQTPFENAAVGKLFGRFKDRFSKLFANELKDIDPTQYLDQEICDIYQQIGVEVPDAGSRQQKPSPARTATEEEEPGDDEPTDESQTNSPVLPPTKSAHNTTQHMSPDPAGEDSEPDFSDTAAETTSPPLLTPKKRRGAKRVHTPGSGKLKSPLNRKRTRVQSPRFVH